LTCSKKGHDLPRTCLISISNQMAPGALNARLEWPNSCKPDPEDKERKRRWLQEKMREQFVLCHLFSFWVLYSLVVKARGVYPRLLSLERKWVINVMSLLLKHIWTTKTKLWYKVLHKSQLWTATTYK
jgi:hypothetical protein